MDETMQAWLYRDGRFERVEIQWDEASESNLDMRLELLGFSSMLQLPSDPLGWKLYQRDLKKESKYSYEYLVVIAFKLRWELVFCNAFPDFLEWLKHYGSILALEQLAKLQPVSVEAKNTVANVSTTK